MRVKAIKSVVGSLLLILLVLAGALAYLPVYLEDHRGLIEASATRALGRTVEIQGGLSFAWSPFPSMVAHGLRISNPGWARHAQLVRAARVEVQLDLEALLERRIRIKRLLVHKADIDLETGPEGQANWTFGSGEASSGVPQIELLEVLDSTLVFEATQRTTHRLGVARLAVRGLGSAQPEVAATVSYRDKTISVSATAGGEAGVRTNRWPFTIQAKTADATLEVTGDSATPFAFSSIEADLELQGENLRSLQGLVPFDGLAQGPFRLAFRLIRDGTGYRFDNIAGSLDAPAPLGALALTGGEVSVSKDSALSGSLDGTWRQIPAAVTLSLAGTDPQTPLGPRGLEITSKLGDTVMSGSLQMVTREARSKITGDLRFAKIDLTGIARDRDAARGPAPQQGKRIPWSERLLPLAIPRTFDADLELRADLVTAKRIRITEARGHALLENGRLRLEGFSIKLPALPLSGWATLDATASPPVLEVALSARRLQLPRAFAFLYALLKTTGDLQAVTLRAKARGDTPAALLETLDGKLTADMARLRIDGKQGEISLRKPTVTVAPGKNVGIRTGLWIDQQALSLGLTGGRLVDLLTQEGPWPKLAVIVQGKLDREAVEVRGDVGPLEALLAGRDLRIDLAIRHRGMKANLKGRLARLDGLRDSKLALKASGESLSSVGLLLGADLPRDQPFLVSARLEGGDRRLDIRDLKVSSGDSDIAGNLRIHLGAKTMVEATLDSRTIDLTPYLGRQADSPASVRRSLSEPLSLENLHVLDGVLRLKADHVRIGDFGIDNGDLDAALDAGHLRLSANAGQDRLAVELELRPERTQWRLSLRHKGKLDLSWLIEEENSGALSKTPAAIDVRLSGVGDSPQTLLGSAAGRMELVLGAGRLNKKVAGLPFGDVLVSLLDSITPPSRKGLFEDLRCAVFQFDVSGGIATSTRGLAVQTAAINALGGGALDLRSGEIELHFKTAQRKGIGINLLGIADRFVLITGTLQEPRIALDPKGLLLHGGAAWATGGLSLLYDQLAKRLTAFGNPCDLVMRRSEHGRD